jgi:hypothetical protein
MQLVSGRLNECLTADLAFTTVAKIMTIRIGDIPSYILQDLELTIQLAMVK